MQYTKCCAVWLVVLALILSLALTGCGKNETEESAAEPAEETEQVSDTEEAVPEETPETIVIDAAENGIVGVTLIVNESDDGTQTVAGAAVQYGSSIDAASLTTSVYSVTSGGTEYYISDIYTNSKAAFADGSQEGCYVILVLTENSWEAMEEADEEAEGTDDAIETDEEPPFETEEEPEVTPYGDDGEEESYQQSPESVDSDAEGLNGSSPEEETDAEAEDTESETAEDMLTISVIQKKTIMTTDQVKIGPSPAVYESTAVAVA